MRGETEPGSRPRARTLAVLATVLVLVAAVVVVLLPRSAEPVTRVADELRPPPGSTLTSETVEPPRVVCLGDNPCPSVRRIWRVGRAVTHEELTTLLAGTGWDLAVDPACDLKENVLSQQTACQATGVTDGYSVTVTVLATIGDPSSTELALSVSPAPDTAP